MQVFSVYHWSTPFTYDIDYRDSKLYMFMIDEHSMVPGGTEDEITDFICFCQETLESGVYPSTLHDRKTPVTGHRAKVAGQPLASGMRASFTGWTGDIKERVRVHKFPRHYQCNFLCEKCLGCKHLPNGNAYDFAPDAGWKGMLISQRHNKYIRNQWKSRNIDFI